MKLLPFSKQLKLPIDVVTQRTAFLGISGSGKTYAVSKLVEDVIAAGGQVVVIDTVGNWWGLRLAANGKSAGIPIPILGGDHADVPLEASSGKLTATTAAQSRASMILDISDLSEDEQIAWAYAFSTEFLRAKKSSRSPVLVVWEEVQDIIPQLVSGKDAQRTLRAVQRLIKRGRNYGVGTALISQRSAAVNKEALNQIETLFAFRTVGRQDRDAIADWVAKKQAGKIDLVEELPHLPTGSCWVWSPAWLGEFKRVSVNKKRTFDATATPTFDDDLVAGTLKPVDLAKFQDKMGKAIEKAKDSDPAFLRSQAAKLRAEVHNLTVELERARATTKPGKTIEKPIIKPTDVSKLESLIARFETKCEQLYKEAHAVVGHTNTLRALVAKASTAPSYVLPKNSVPPPRQRLNLVLSGDMPVRQRLAQREEQATNGEHKLGRCERAILQALASRFPTPLERTQIATLAGYSPGSGGFANALSALRTAGFIAASDGNRVLLTNSGRDEAGDVQPVHDPASMFLLWKNKLPNREGDILHLLIESADGGLTRDEIAQETGLSAGSGGFANYLSHLNSNKLIRKGSDGRIRAAELFLR